MLTPLFNIYQDSKYVIFNIKLPYVKISSSEIYVNNKDFKFNLHPYFLSLTFDQAFEDNGIASSIYNHNTFYLTIKVIKLNENEHFDNLNMITKLKTKTEENKIIKFPKIEVLNEIYNENNINENEIINEFKDLSINNFVYGFGNNYEGIFKNLQVLLLGRDFRNRRFKSRKYINNK